MELIYGIRSPRSNALNSFVCTILAQPSENVSCFFPRLLRIFAKSTEYHFNHQSQQKSVQTNVTRGRLLDQHHGEHHTSSSSSSLEDHWSTR